MSLRRFVTLCSFLVAAAGGLAGCDAPPQKEMSRAEGAIQAAKAAGAEMYAADELATAQLTLDRANESAAQNDYRQALAYALDALEFAQDAARSAAARKAEARGAIEQAVAAADVALADAAKRLADADAAKVRATLLAQPRKRLSVAQERLQEARSAASREEFKAANALLEQVTAEATAIVSLIDAARTPPPRRRR